MQVLSNDPVTIIEESLLNLDIIQINWLNILTIYLLIYETYKLNDAYAINNKKPH